MTIASEVGSPEATPCTKAPWFASATARRARARRRRRRRRIRKGGRRAGKSEDAVRSRVAAVETRAVIAPGRAASASRASRAPSPSRLSARCSGAARGDARRVFITRFLRHARPSSGAEVQHLGKQDVISRARLARRATLRHRNVRPNPDGACPPLSSLAAAAAIGELPLSTTLPPRSNAGAAVGGSLTVSPAIPPPTTSIAGVAMPPIPPPPPAPSTSPMAPGNMLIRLGFGLDFFLCTSSPTTSKFLYVYPMKSSAFFAGEDDFAPPPPPAAALLPSFPPAAASSPPAGFFPGGLMLSSSSKFSKFCVSNSPVTSGSYGARIAYRLSHGTPRKNACALISSTPPAVPNR
eukprot:31124-Pelagococcus_subviridis.AAC.3